MMRTLQEWEKRSGIVKNLQGKHIRAVFDKTFATESRAEGVFYYESPDKGRIDINPAKIQPGAKSKFKDPKTGEPYKLQPADPEKWICDGKTIWQVDEQARTAENFEIPPANQGQNIMEGPLPFLFGMPAELAIKRYKLEFAQVPKRGDKTIRLLLQPRWPQDAANWSKAMVTLDSRSFLPTRVQLVDPAGTSATIYTFSKVVANKNKLAFLPRIWRNDPFKVDLDKYRMIVKKDDRLPKVPALRGMSAKSAQKTLEDSKYQIKWIQGVAAPNKNLTYVVYLQEPRPGEPLAKGQFVHVTVYDKPGARKAAKPRVAKPKSGARSRQ